MAAHGDDILFRTGAAPGIRLAFGAIGIVVAIWPAWDLHPWKLPLPFALIPWVIVIGAWIIAAGFLTGAVFGRTGEVRAVPGGLELIETGWPGPRRRFFPAEHLGDPTVRRWDSDGGPDTYDVAMSRHRRPALASPSFATSEEAEALAARLRVALGR